MSALKSLLPKLLQPNFSNISNLPSLQKLLKASSAASSQFATLGATIFEHALSSRQMHEYTCALIRIATLLRAKALPPHVYNLVTFTDFVRHETTPHRYWPPAWAYPPTRLPPTIPVSALLGILATHQKIEGQVIGCLKTYLARFKPLRPCHLTDPKFEFEFHPSNDPDKPSVPVWDQWPEQKPFLVHDIGPPTWVEEQRVFRAFWRVQLFHDLREAAATGSLNWPKDDLKELENLTAVHFHDPCRPTDLQSSCPLRDISPAEREKLHQEWWHILGFDSEYFEPEYSKYAEQLEAGEMTIEHYLDWDTPPVLAVHEAENLSPYHRVNFLEDELVWSALEYAEEASQAQFTNTSDSHTEREWPVPTEGDRDWDEVTSAFPSTLNEFHDVTRGKYGHKWTWKCTPLQHVSFRPFRRLGFGIWSLERMACYGLSRFAWDHKEKRRGELYLFHDNLYNAWRSILGKSELLEVERRNLAWETGTADTVKLYRHRGPDA
ncbi:hypothetical protein GQ53DRAFT_745341 [Thozetella sp. PMI_491]|nr:hypothetical protein GQ53DRAFT_745341 [Thozetella sp. PMI_491]